MRRDHDLVGLVLGHPEFRLEHGDDELARRIVVIEQDHLVQAWPFRLGADFGLRLGDGVIHPAASMSTVTSTVKAEGYNLPPGRGTRVCDGSIASAKVTTGDGAPVNIADLI